MSKFLKVVYIHTYYYKISHISDLKINIHLSKNNVNIKVDSIIMKYSKDHL